MSEQTLKSPFKNLDNTGFQLHREAEKEHWLVRKGTTTFLFCSFEAAAAYADGLAAPQKLVKKVEAQQRSIVLTSITVELHGKKPMPDAA